MRVLAVDDEHYIRNLLQRCLRTWGYEAVTAEDGASAWEILRREDSPRVVIIDWDMPKMKGVEVVRLLRTTEHGHDVYVVMLTGRMKKTDLVEALEAGVDDYLTKPFNSRELQLRLARAIAAQEERAAVHAGTPQSPPKASTIGGKYRLEKPLGEGGMAEVWLATHLALDTFVAIKFMKPVAAAQPDYASFEREARAAARLRSEHILHIYDHGIAKGGLPYLVMEYLPGESLGERVLSDGPMPVATVVTLVDQIARALAAAHAQEIIHRDVKPENIILVERADWPHGLAKLVDFGLARSETRRADTGGAHLGDTELHAAGAPPR